MTFERILTYPHGLLREFLKPEILTDAGKELDKIYVAITRTRQSEAFVVSDNAMLSALKFYET
jgi:DNA helicase-2/ATP-dependent DNA helicase PcrA